MTARANPFGLACYLRLLAPRRCILSNKSADFFLFIRSETHTEQTSSVGD